MHSDSFGPNSYRVSTEKLSEGTPVSHVPQAEAQKSLLLDVVHGGGRVRRCQATVAGDHCAEILAASQMQGGTRAEPGTRMA